MADQDFGKGDKFFEVIQRKEIYESLRPLMNEVKEAQEYEDEHGMDNWGYEVEDYIKYDLLVEVFDKFFRQMRREPNLLMLTDEQLAQLWEKDWDALRGPISNIIEDTLDSYSNEFKG